ncbi:uncharacterized protein LOC135484474 [Lineus longissimus]|uniref:uncharacterized protein LOC135484474 n=1 Tax=Lineus longissimus TaxID=88925 RepID=UPI00315D877D
MSFQPKNGEEKFVTEGEKTRCEKCQKGVQEYHKFDGCGHLACKSCLAAHRGHSTGKSKTAVEFSVSSPDCPICQIRFLFPEEGAEMPHMPTFSQFNLVKALSCDFDEVDDDTHVRFRKNCCQHEEADAEHVCKKCNVMICSECLPRHCDAAHDVINMADYVAELEEYVNAMFKKVNSSYKKLKRYTEEIKAKRDITETTLRNAIRRVNESAKASLVDLEKEREQTVGEIKSTQTKYERSADVIATELSQESNALLVYLKLQQVAFGDGKWDKESRIVRMAEFLQSNESILQSSLCQARYLIEETEILLEKKYHFVEGCGSKDYDEARTKVVTPRCGRLLSKSKIEPVLVLDCRTATDDGPPLITSVCPCRNGDLVITDCKNLKVKCFTPPKEPNGKHSVNWESSGNEEVKLRWPKFARQSSDGSRVIVSDLRSYFCVELSAMTGHILGASTHPVENLTSHMSLSNTEVDLVARPTGIDSELPWPVIQMAFQHGYVLPKLLSQRKLFPMKACYSITQDMFAIFCREPINDRGVMVISTAGEPLRCIYLEEVKPCDITVTPDAHVLVADSVNAQVFMLRKTGEFVGICIDRYDGMERPVFIRASREIHHGRYGVYVAENNGVLKVYSMQATGTYLPRMASLSRIDPGY